MFYTLLRIFILFFVLSFLNEFGARHACVRIVADQIHSKYQTMQAHMQFPFWHFLGKSNTHSPSKCMRSLINCVFGCFWNCFHQTASDELLVMMDNTFEKFMSSCCSLVFMLFFRVTSKIETSTKKKKKIRMRSIPSLLFNISNSSAKSEKLHYKTTNISIKLSSNREVYWINQFNVCQKINGWDLKVNTRSIIRVMWLISLRDKFTINRVALISETNFH